MDILKLTDSDINAIESVEELRKVAIALKDSRNNMFNCWVGKYKEVDALKAQNERMKVIIKNLASEL